MTAIKQICWGQETILDWLATIRDKSLDFIIAEAVGCGVLWLFDVGCGVWCVECWD